MLQSWELAYFTGAMLIPTRVNKAEGSWLEIKRIDVTTKVLYMYDNEYNSHKSVNWVGLANWLLFDHAQQAAVVKPT